MKGLPFKANVEDVLAFFQGYGVSAQGVFLKRNGDGKLNGEVSALALFVDVPMPDGPAPTLRTIVTYSWESPLHVSVLTIVLLFLVQYLDL